MPKEMLDLILTRRPGQPWGFTLAGGRDKGQSLKVGLVIISPVLIEMIRLLKVGLGIILPVLG